MPPGVGRCGSEEWLLQMTPCVVGPVPINNRNLLRDTLSQWEETILARGIRQLIQPLWRTRRRSTEAAEECIRVDLGAKPAGGGQYICPHCAYPPVIHYPKSFKDHVQICQGLSAVVRQQQVSHIGRQKAPWPSCSQQIISGYQRHHLTHLMLMTISLRRAPSNPWRATGWRRNNLVLVHTFWKFPS